MSKLVIKNGTVVDGTKAPRYCADIAIENGIISKIGSDISPTKGDQVIDAAGKIVAPGVIDIHTHYDAQIHWDPYCTSSGWHGTTTVVIGNCGFGFAPCRPQDRERYMQMMQNTEQVPIGAMKKAMNWNWETFPEWINHLKAIPKGVNVANFVPLNPLLAYSMGVDACKARPASVAERQKMRDYLNEAMDAGAIGFAYSFQGEHNSHVDFDGTPMPSDTMAVEEAYNLAEVLKERGQGVVQALVETPGINYRDSLLEVARISGRPVIHNLAMILDAFPEYHTDIYKMLDEAEKEGLSIYSSALTSRSWAELRAGDFNAWDTLPIMREFSTAKDKLMLAQCSDFRARLRKHYDPLQMAASGGSWDTYVLQNAQEASAYSKYEGQSLGSIASEKGVEITDLFMDIIAASKLQADFASLDPFSRDPSDTEEMIRHNRIIPGLSDGGAHPKFFSGGNWSTDSIMWMCREEKRISLEDMHYRFSALPAHVIGLNNRGTLTEDSAADMYIYDYDLLGYDREKYEILHDLPDGDWRRVVRAKGIDWIITNGETTFEKGKATGRTPGRLVGNGGPETDVMLQG